MIRYTKEQLIYYLNKFYKNNKESPTIKKINKNKKYPCASTYINRFGTWNDALRKANLPLNSKTYNKKELIEDIKQLAKELGRIPKTKDLSKKKWAASYSTYRKYFGSWDKVKSQAGLKKSDFRNLSSYLKK
jgi:hypothetical protein